MGILPVEFVLRDLVESDISAVKSDPALLEEILEGYTANTKGGIALLQYMTEYFSNVAIRVVMGHPRDNNLIPCVAITLESDQESDKFFGGYIDDDVIHGDIGNPDVVTGYEEEIGSYFSSIYRLTCYANTGDVVLVLAAIVKTALLRNRLALNGYGILQNELGASDSLPVPEYIPVSAYHRSITFNCKQATTAKVILPTIKEISTEVAPISGVEEG